MKILLLTDGIHPFQIGGMQKHSLQLMKLFIGKEIGVHVVHPGTTEASLGELEDHLEDNKELLSESVIPFPDKGRLPGHYIRSNKAYSTAIYEHLESQLDEYDAIYAQGYAGWKFIEMRKKGVLKTPIYLNFHGLEMFQVAANFKVKLAYAMLRKSVIWNLKNADYVYSFGGKITKILQEIGIPEDQILLQANGIDESWISSSYPKSSKQRHFVFIGRAERRKGIEELNAALEVLFADPNMKDVSFSFIGPVSEQLQLTHEQIHYHGEIRAEDKIKAILSKADCLVCPSHAEGMPTVILEGMAMGLAIIATDVGAVNRQIKGNGILLAVPEVKLIRDALREIALISNLELDQMKAASLQHLAESFTWKTIIEEKIDQIRLNQAGKVN